MTSITLSRRLRQIAAYCPPGARAADIGSDHALLASYLVVQNIASFVVAGELNEGPYQAALRQIHTLQQKERISVRKGDGLAVISPGEVDVVCIAGMGGQLIASILDAGKEKLAGVSRLILQPNVGEEIVRRWLQQHGWQLVEETILEEDGILYEILVAEQGDPDIPYQGQDRSLDELLRLGPLLWRKKPALLIRKWERERTKVKQILQQMSRSDRPETVVRRKETEAELKWIDEVIACLQADN